MRSMFLYKERIHHFFRVYTLRRTRRCSRICKHLCSEFKKIVSDSVRQKMQVQKN